MSLEIGYCNGCNNPRDRCSCWQPPTLHDLQGPGKPSPPSLYSFDYWWQEYVAKQKCDHSDEVSVWIQRGRMGECPKLIIGDKVFAEKVWDAAMDAMEDSRDPRED